MGNNAEPTSGANSTQFLPLPHNKHSQRAKLSETLKKSSGMKIKLHPLGL